MTGPAERTRAGTFLGSPGYAPPEQVDGILEKISPKSDQYALGSILHECLSGEKTFPGSTLEQVLTSMLRGPRPLPRGSAPRELVAVPTKALARDPAGRYESVAALLEEIDRWRAGRPVLAAPDPLLVRLAKFARRHPLALATLAAFTLGAAVAAGLLAIRARSIEARARFEAEAARAAEAQGIDLAAVAAKDALARTDRLLEDRESDLERARIELALAALFLAEIPPDREDLARPLALQFAVLEAKLAFQTADRPHPWPSHAEARRRGRVYDEVLVRIAAARALGAEDPVLAEFERNSHGAGPLRIATDPAGIPVRLHRLAIDQTEPGELRSTFTPESPAATLDAGGYVLVVDHPDYAPCRLPVYLMREDSTNRQIVIPLVPKSTVPEGFAYIPPGWFLAGEECRLVRMEKGFVIARHELTWAEWAPYGETLGPEDQPTLNLASGETAPLLPLMKRAHPTDWQEYPVTGVSHDDLAAWCLWKSANDPRFEYRLPTTEEWEYAARGADGRVHPWGDAYRKGATNVMDLRERYDIMSDMEPAARGRWLGSSIAETLRDTLRLLLDASYSPRGEKKRALLQEANLLLELLRHDFRACH